MIRSLVSPYRTWRYRRSLRTIRETFALLGYPLDAMTDEDIERSAVAFDEAWNKDTFTFEQQRHAWSDCARRRIRLAYV